MSTVGESVADAMAALQEARNARIIYQNMSAAREGAAAKDRAGRDLAGAQDRALMVLGEAQMNILLRIMRAVEGAPVDDGSL